MSQLKFYTVEAPLNCIGAAPGKVVDAFPDLLDLHLLAGFSKEGIGIGRRSPDREPGDRTVRLHAVVVQLGKYPGIVFMNALCQFFITGNHFGPVGIHQFFIGMIRGMDRHLLCRNQAAASLGPLPVIMDMTFADLLIFPKVGHMGCEMNPVRHHDGAYFYWRKEISEFTHSLSPDLLPSKMAVPIPLGATQSPAR